MAQTVQEALRQASFYSDDEPYLLVKLPPSGITAAAGVVAEISDPFCALIVDKDEVTLVVPHEAVEEFGRRMRDHISSTSYYRLITIDAVLEPDLVGFMAAVSAALAQAGVPVFPYAAYSRDHILVPADQYDAALAALEKLKAGA
jgi:hypothetical protein